VSLGLSPASAKYKDCKRTLEIIDLVAVAFLTPLLKFKVMVMFFFLAAQFPVKENRSKRGFNGVANRGLERVFPLIYRENSQTVATPGRKPQLWSSVLVD